MRSSWGSTVGGWICNQLYKKKEVGGFHPVLGSAGDRRTTKPWKWWSTPPPSSSLPTPSTTTTTATAVPPTAPPAPSSSSTSASPASPLSSGAAVFLPSFLYSWIGRFYRCWVVLLVFCVEQLDCGSVPTAALIGFSMSFRRFCPRKIRRMFAAGTLYFPVFGS